MPTQPSPASAPSAVRAHYQPFARVAFRGTSEDSRMAETYVSNSPFSSPRYVGRIDGVRVYDQSTLKAEYDAIVKEVHS